MAGLEDLAAYLVLGDTQRKAIAAEDPYAGGEQIGSQLVNAVSQAKDYDTNERIVAAALSGLAGGLFGGFSDDYRARAEKAYQDSIVDTIVGGGGERPSVLTPSLWRSAQERGSLFNIQRGLARKELEQKSELARAEKISGALADQGLVVGKNGELVRLFDPAKDAAAKAGGIKTAELEAENKFFGGDASKNPRSPQYQVDQDTQKNMDALRKELSARKEFANFNEVSNRYNVLKKAFTDGSAISDIDFAVNVAKIFDPASVVRESETGQVIDSQSVPSSILGTINRKIAGGASIDLPTRISLLEAAGRHHATQKAAMDQLRTQYEGIAKERGIDPSKVLPPPEVPFTYSKDQLRSLASRFPDTPEGRASFKTAAAILGQ